MSFVEKCNQIQNFNIQDYLAGVSEHDVENILKKNKLDETDFLYLLSPAAENYLEEMAQKAHNLTNQWFGKTIQLYMPLYISNYCQNQCRYCGFNQKNKIKRRKLSLKEIEKEARIIADKGIRHVVVLTGESRKHTPLSYLQEAIRISKKYFASVCLEIFPLKTEEYRKLNQSGADCLTVYQEVYDRKIYRELHPSGPKRNYEFRLDTPERAARAGFRAVNIGTLFGLANVEKEAYLSGLHAHYLENNYLDCEISLSIPRLNDHEGDFTSEHNLSDKKFVQILLAYRLFLPKVGINISTRESANFRNNLLKLGVTKMSAGSRTEVGGYQKDNKTSGQFDISDRRSVKSVVNMIKKSGYQPVFKNWEQV
ncbi:MAG TPA: 2-iminoacetate synthase ThiH [bacterium]|nr:2-iminoacetate synthase ThiH [bacterium]